MIAHIVHDDSGRIKSVVIQASELEGELEIHPPEQGDMVTTVELRDVFPEIAVDSGDDAGSSKHQLYLIVRDIRNEFRVDAKRKTLERRSPR